MGWYDSPIKEYVMSDAELIAAYRHALAVLRYYNATDCVKTRRLEAEKREDAKRKVNEYRAEIVKRNLEV